MSSKNYEFLFKHEKKINRIVANCYLCICLIPVIILIMSLAGYYNYPINLAVTGVAVSLFMAGVLFFLNGTGVLPSAFKYVTILSMQFIVFLYSIDVNIQMTISYMVTPLFALMYFNPGFTAYACFLSFVSMVVSTCISAPQAVEILWKGVSPLQYVLTTGSGRVLEFVFGSVILVSASNFASKLMISLNKRNEEINKMQNELVYSFADMIESRDGTTGEHVKRTSYVVSLLTKYIVNHADQFSYELSKHEYELIAMAAPLHDIGKMKVPDSILSKPGKLTDSEYDIIKTHSSEGAKIIDKTMAKIENAEYIKFAREMALSHHEKWNGKGYPQGLSEEQIPVSARIMAVADVFDALCSERSYKKPYTIDQAFDILVESKGSHFEPVLVDAMIELRPELSKIYGHN